MNQVTRFPPLNTLRIIPANDVLPARHNTYPFDRGFFYQQIRTFYQQRVTYAQKVAGGDNIAVYFDSLASSAYLRIIDADNNVIVDIGVVVGNDMNLAGVENLDSYYGEHFFTHTSLILPSVLDLADGFYFLAIENLYNAEGDPANTIFISECFQYRAAGWPQTMLIEYTHFSNDFDILFPRVAPGINYFNFRAEMAITEVNPAFHDTGFENMFYQAQTLQSVPYRTMELTVGGANGVPPWVMDKVNRILSCNEVYIDNVRYVKDSNPQWAMKKVDGYPNKVGVIILREADHDAGWEYVTPARVPTFRIHTDAFDETFN